MPDDKSNPKSSKRNLPAWMSSRQSGGGGGGGGGESSNGNKSTDDSNEPKNSSDHSKKEAKSNEKSGFSKLLEGVVFVLSGFVYPECGTLRSQTLETGAEFKQDWNSDCTLLICAFVNTPNFRQVESDCGTIISKEWIYECHKQKQLVAIEPYLLHDGKPWRKTLSRDSKREQKHRGVQLLDLLNEPCCLHGHALTFDLLASKRVYFSQQITYDGKIDDGNVFYYEPLAAVCDAKVRFLGSIQRGTEEERCQWKELTAGLKVLSNVVDLLNPPAE